MRKAFEYISWSSKSWLGFSDSWFALTSTFSSSGFELALSYRWAEAETLKLYGTRPSYLILCWASLSFFWISSFFCCSDLSRLPCFEVSCARRLFTWDWAAANIACLRFSFISLVKPGIFLRFVDLHSGRSSKKLFLSSIWKYSRSSSFFSSSSFLGAGLTYDLWKISWSGQRCLIKNNWNSFWGGEFKIRVARFRIGSFCHLGILLSVLAFACKSLLTMSASCNFVGGVTQV